MCGESLKDKARSLSISPGTKGALVQKLIVAGSVDNPISSQELALNAREMFGETLKTIHIQTHMKPFLVAGIVRAVKHPGSRNNFWVLASMPKEEAIRYIRKSCKIITLEEDLFSPPLVAKLRNNFGDELSELHDNFGKNPNCSAFMMRKILEKLLIITFAKNGLQHLLEDKARPGGWKVLKDMIEIAAREKVNGISFLGHQTAQETKGIKFLGDTAAHNPLVGVDIATILPQMPFVITAYKELAERL
jgi:hypothetical protein